MTKFHKLISQGNDSIPEARRVTFVSDEENPSVFIHVCYINDKKEMDALARERPMVINEEADHYVNIDWLINRADDTRKSILDLHKHNVLTFVKENTVRDITSQTDSTRDILSPVEGEPTQSNEAAHS